jgi:predicted DNA-binding ribbon-helix-helix protein
MNVSKYSMNKNKVATTVKVESTLYDEFKVLGVRHKLTLQGLVEKTVFRYVREDIFRTEMNNFNLPLPLSSSWSAVTSSLA